VHTPFFKTRHIAAAALAATLAASAQAAQVQVKVTTQNLVAADGIAFAPLHLGFNNGTFDAFDLGGVASAAIQSVAEGGAGGDWFPAFAAADPGATLGTVVDTIPLLPGAMAMNSFTVDSSANRYFTFAAMVVPSNDFFIGNDSPTALQLFDAAGNLQLATVGQTARQIWDAGSEVFDPAAAAFVGDNDLRTPQGSVVAFNFAELAAFNGLTTGTGYTFESTLGADSDVYRISFEVTAVPEPQSYTLLAAGLLAVGWVAKRRRREELTAA
jgi:hypothetical protein